MTAAFLSVDQLEVSYGSVVAVGGVDFTVSRGEHVTLLGPSGCGKTTTLRLIAGLEAPTRGRIIIDGVMVTNAATRRFVPPERRGLSMVFQSYAIWPHMTVFDNVAFGFRVRGVSRADARPAVERALALVDLADLTDRPATQLSGGQQQRVALARALVMEPRVLLADEPTGNLDTRTSIEVMDIFQKLNRERGITVLLITHEMDIAEYGTRIVTFRDGQVVADKPVTKRRLAKDELQALPPAQAV